MQARALCPRCGQYRNYYSAAAARRAEARNTQCRPCTNVERNTQPLVLGFSESEYNVIKDAARRRGKSWDMTLADLHDLWEKQDGRCALTGTPMQKTPRTWSMDRIDNSCGYAPANIQLVLKHVNMMRGSLPTEIFVEVCQAVTNHRSNT